MLMHEKGTDKMTAAIAILIVNFTRYICSAACELIFGSRARTNQNAHPYTAAGVFSIFCLPRARFPKWKESRVELRGAAETINLSSICFAAWLLN
jgi:hypothetical protein